MILLVRSRRYNGSSDCPVLMTHPKLWPPVCRKYSAMFSSSSSNRMKVASSRQARSARCSDTVNKARSSYFHSHWNYCPEAIEGELSRTQMSPKPRGSHVSGASVVERSVTLCALTWILTGPCAVARHRRARSAFPDFDESSQDVQDRAA